MSLLAALFFGVALLYAMVGFGGGSSYVAFLALFDRPYQDIPQVALVCNMIVVTGGTLHFLRQGHFRWPLFWPFVVSSVPLAFLGGRLPLSKTVFLGLLGGSLVVAGLRLLLLKSGIEGEGADRRPPLPGALALGGGLGFLSGLVGIGGGIFLSPAMMNLRWGRPKQIAATASAFILVNSVSGLLGQIAKRGGVGEVVPYWPLFLAVLVGGQLGSCLGAGALPQRWVRLLTAALVLWVGTRVLWKALG
ncbi:MAG: sulfite exporter TauE/SafE family protein [Lentisphaerae bacterium]|nr:sulfite exporter TauE/SafE family protein [Lentisphaerota bacterium]